MTPREMSYNLAMYTFRPVKITFDLFDGYYSRIGEMLARAEVRRALTQYDYRDIEDEPSE